MKRLLPSAIAIALIAAGCGSGGSTTSAASKPKPAPHHKRRKPKKVVHHKKVSHHKKVVHKRRKTVVTTTAVTTTAATTTFSQPTTTTSAPPPPPPTTTTSVAPTTTQQTTTHHKSKNNNNSHGTYCLSVTSVIATPRGSVPVARVRPGMYVWSTDLSGRRVAERVLRVHHTAAPANHLMVRLRLADGRHVLVSLGHPMPNGEPVRTLSAGQSFDGSRVVSATRVRYGRPYTYDLLPAGPTHTYFADGVLLGSTLSPTFVPGGDGALARPF